MSQLGESGEIKTRSLAEAVQGIDIAIFSEKNIIADADHQKRWSSFTRDTDGSMMGLVTMKFDDKGTHSASEIRSVKLDPSVPDHKEMAGLVEAYKKSGK